MSLGYCFDAGALIAIERGHRGITAMLQEARRRADLRLDIPAGALAQVWRGGGRQSRLARFIRGDGVRVAELDRVTALAVGALCGLVGASDVVDGHVALHAARRDLVVITSDPDDIARFGGGVEIVTI